MSETRNSDDASNAKKVYADHESKIIQVVKNQTQKYENRDHEINWTKSIGSNSIHCVSFIGEDGGYRRHYVYETDTVMASFGELENLIKAAELRTSILDIQPNKLRTMALAAIALFSVMTICILAIGKPDNPALEAMIAFAGLTIGYLAGKPA